MRSDIDLQRFTDALLETMSPKNRPRELIALQVKLMKRLLTGDAVPPDEVASIAQRPAEDIPIMLAMAVEMGFAELDESGNLVGMVVTRRPTRHAISNGGSKAHAWCAIDTLFLPAVLERPLSVRSSCPETNSTIALEIGTERIESVTPSEVCVSLVAPGITERVDKCGAGVAGLTTSEGAFCGNSNFYASREAAQEWLAQHKGAVVLAVHDAFALATEVWSEPYREAAGECTPG